MNSKVKDLEKVSFGIATMFGVYWIYSCFIKQHLAIAEGVKTIIGLVVLYVLGFGVFLFVTRNIPTRKYDKKKVSINC